MGGGSRALRSEGGFEGRRTVANRPAGLLARLRLGGLDRLGQDLEDASINDGLRRLGGAGEDVAQRAQRGGARLVVGALLHDVHQEGDDARLDAQVNAVVAAVGHVRESPACVHQDLLVAEHQQLRERRHRLRHVRHRWLRLATHQVGESPHSVAQRAHLPHRRGRLDELEHDSCGVVGEDEVAHRRAVAGDVADRPHGLLAHVDVGRRHEGDKGGHAAIGDDSLALGRRARGDVGQAPRGLELELVLGVAEHRHERRHEARVDARVDGRVARERELLAQEADRAERGIVLLGGAVARDEA